jgi:hypothetical protein
MAGVDDTTPPKPGSKPGGKPGALSDAKSFFTKHKNESLAAGALGVVGLALYHRHNQQASADQPLDTGATSDGAAYPSMDSGYPASGDGGGSTSFPKSINVTVKTPRISPPSPTGRKPKPKPRPHKKHRKAQQGPNPPRRRRLPIKKANPPKHHHPKHPNPPKQHHPKQHRGGKT